MRTPSVFCALSFLAACSANTADEHNELMNLIESKVRLPAGAGPLSKYTRHYALDDRGLVIGVYLSGVDGRKWLDSPDEMPFIADGGCGVVTVEYDPQTDRVGSADCNGEA